MTPPTNLRDALQAREPPAVGELILAEVPQGFGTARVFNEASRLPGALEPVALGAPDIAIEASGPPTRENTDSRNVAAQGS